MGKDFNRLMHRAYGRYKDEIYTGEALLLAMLMHTHGSDRNSKEMNDLLRIMRDANVSGRK